jgi:Fic family protein
MTLQQLRSQYYSDFQTAFDQKYKGQDFFGIENTKSEKPMEFDYLLQVSSLFSSKIEGNSLDLNSYFNQAQFDVKSQSKEFTEVFNLASAYNFAKLSPISESNFLKVHKITTSSFLEKFQVGKYRQNPVGVFGSSGIVYMAVEPKLVSKETKNLFLEIKKVLSQKPNMIEALFYAGLIHLRIAQIHPFADGNGRMARLLEKWFLSSIFGEMIWGLQSEKYIFEHKSEYYSKISLGSDFYNLDYSKSVEFCEFVADSYFN